MDDGTERWLPVVGYEGYYEVSDLGRVRSLDRPTGHRGRVLRQNTTPRGYLRVGLYRPGRKCKTWPVHQLVAYAFLGPCPAGKEILHGRGGPLDNRLVNLSYDVHIRNCEDRAEDKLYHYKLTLAIAAEIKVRVAAGEARKLLAAEYGVNQSMISRIVNGQRWSAA